MCRIDLDNPSSQSLIHQVSVSEMSIFIIWIINYLWSQSLIHQVSVSEDFNSALNIAPIRLSQSLIHQVSVSEDDVAVA